MRKRIGIIAWFAALFLGAVLSFRAISELISDGDLRNFVHFGAGVILCLIAYALVRWVSGRN
ncbi:hypothetical protein D3C85_1928180 [compost metagenome]